MANDKNALQKKYQLRSRYPNFGNILSGMRIMGFRRHGDTIVEFKSPVTAFSGLNGSGKSTILELAACAYVNQEGSTFYISQFFAISPLDPSPFQPDARVSFSYWNGNDDSDTINIARSRTRSAWEGYDNRRQRPVFFPQSHLHQPRGLRKDFVLRNSGKLEVEKSKPVSSETLVWCSQILGKSYSCLDEATVRFRKQSTPVLAAEHNSLSYSESHMGFGEGRVQTLVHQLEACPPKSLILLEEPEIALHQSAQYELALYFIDLACRKGHQILLTTHSNYLLNGLPQASVVYLETTTRGIELLNGISSDMTLSLLSGGHPRTLTVLVEDDCAKIVLSAILRRTDQHFLKNVDICTAGALFDDGNREGGGCKEIITAMKVLAGTGLNICAVLDGDINVDGYSGLPVFKLPGELPPEKELLSNADVCTYFEQEYGKDIGDFLSARIDHHHYFRELAHIYNANEQALVSQAAEIYAKSVTPTELATLTERLKETAAQKNSKNKVIPRKNKKK